MPDGAIPNWRTRRSTVATLLVVATRPRAVRRLRGRARTAHGGRRHSKTAVLMVAVGLVVPGALVALTSSTAGAQDSNPLGPTITQVEQTTATAVANAQNQLAYVVAASGWLKSDVTGWLSPSCLGLGPTFSGPDPYCFPYLGAFD